MVSTYATATVVVDNSQYRAAERTKTLTQAAKQGGSNVSHDATLKAVDALSVHVAQQTQAI